MSYSVIAAGAVIWRRNSDKDIEVAVVHRPRYDDWSIPKGKLEEGESLIACAFREGQEETGLNFTFGPYIGDVEYPTVDGLKRVSYWSARYIHEDREFHPNIEVDRLEWWPIQIALERLSRESDVEILARFLDTPFEATPLILLRHAKALNREEWQGEDEDRPLDNTGQIQAKRMHSVYQVFNIQKIVTSDAVRCYDTVTNMARIFGVEPVITSAVSEYVYKKNKDKCLDFVRELADEVGELKAPTILCSHNPVLPKMLGKLLKKSELKDESLPAGKLNPGDAWVVYLKKRKVVAVEYIPAP
jgi:8-oxo-dGTP diphosphatase